MDTKVAYARRIKELVNQLNDVISEAWLEGLIVELSQTDVTTLGSPRKMVVLSVVVTQEVA